LNEKNKYGYTPILVAMNNNNFELIKLLLEYANKHNIKLKHDEKYLFFKFVLNNNFEMVISIIEYVDDNNIIIELNKNF